MARRATPEEAQEVAAAKSVAKADAAAKPAAKAKAKAIPPKFKAPPKEPLLQQLTTGIFAPLVALGYWLVGEPFVDKVRGKGIALHSRAIGAFCETFSLPIKRKQGFIKTAKKTGHDLGFLIPGGYFGDGLLGEPAMQWYKDSGIDRW